MGAISFIFISLILGAQEGIHPLHLIDSTAGSFLARAEKKEGRLVGGEEDVLPSLLPRPFSPARARKREERGREKSS